MLKTNIVNNKSENTQSNDLRILAFTERQRELR